jgi:hypothetical protein
MLNILLITPSHPDAALTVRAEIENIRTRLREGQVEGLGFRHLEATSPELLAKMLAEEHFDVIHVNMSTGPADQPKQGQGEEAVSEVERSLLGSSGNPAETAGRPLVILDACSAQQAVRILPGEFPCLIELPAGIDRDSALAFVAALYETLTRGHSLQTAFWLGCCRTRASEESLPCPKICRAPDFDPRKQLYGGDLAPTIPVPSAYGHQLAPKIPAPSTTEFFEKYVELCEKIKETILKPLLEQYGKLMARVFQGDGPVPVDQEREFSNDFAYLTIAIYRGPRALELQRKMFQKYEDPSGQNADLYEWTVSTEVGEAELEKWVKEKAREKYEAFAAPYRMIWGEHWQKNFLNDAAILPKEPSASERLSEAFLKRDMEFAGRAGKEFSILMRGLYNRYREGSNPDLLLEPR